MGLLTFLDHILHRKLGVLREGILHAKVHDERDVGAVVPGMLGTVGLGMEEVEVFLCIEMILAGFHSTLDLDENSGHDGGSDLLVPEENRDDEVDEALSTPADERHASNESCEHGMRVEYVVVACLSEMRKSDPRVLEYLPEGFISTVSRCAVQDFLSHLLHENRLYPVYETASKAEKWFVSSLRLAKSFGNGAVVGLEDEHASDNLPSFPSIEKAVLHELLDDVKQN